MVEWTEIPGFNGKYFINEVGQIKSHCMGRIKILKPSLSKPGYYRIQLSTSNGKYPRYFLHRLIAITFIPKVEGKDFINHKNGIKTDNRIENLEWVTCKENSQHASKNNLLNTCRGEQAGGSKLTTGQVLKIRELYSTGEYSYRVLGRQFNINGVGIHDIINRITWKHI